MVSRLQIYWRSHAMPGQRVYLTTKGGDNKDSKGFADQRNVRTIKSFHGRVTPK
jgi:hypothetical protein